MTNIIVSRAANDINYAIYKKNANNTFSVVKSIIVKGGADVIDKKTLITNKGATTIVSDEDLELLKQNSLFKKHIDNGFIIVFSNKEDAEKTKEDGLLEKSKSSQLTTEELEEKEDVIVEDGTNTSKKRKKK